MRTAIRCFKERRISLLKDKTAWLVMSEAMGHRVIASGVAQALGVDFEEKIVDPPKPWSYLAPWGPVAPMEKLGAPESKLFPKPWPDFVMGVGRQSVPYLRAFKKRSEGKTFTVMLQDPRNGTQSADFIWVPEHDKLRGGNVMTTLLSPHRFSPAVIEDLRKKALPEIAALPKPHIGLIIGGNSKAFTYSQDNIDKLVRAVESVKDFAGSFLITCSRRTPPALEQALRNVTADTPRFFWDGNGYNPYPDFLAHSDFFIVTADSVNMVGEATISGKPVYVFFPEGGSKRIDYYHQRLQEEGITRPLPDQFTALESWDYTPQYSAGVIAAEIVKRWAAKAETG